MSKAGSSITVYGGATLRGTVRRDPSGTPFVVKGIYIQDGTDTTLNVTDESNFSTFQTTVPESPEAFIQWVIQLSDGPNGVNQSVGQFLSAKTPISQLSMNVRVPGYVFSVIEASREFRVVVVMCRPEHADIQDERYTVRATGCITLDAFGNWSFTWEQID